MTTPGVETRRSRERTTDTGIIVPGHNAGHPMVVCQTNIPNLQINVAIDHEAPGGLEAMQELAIRISRAQVALETGDYDDHIVDFVDPQFGERSYLTPTGIRSVVAVLAAYAQEVDLRASQAMQQPVFRAPQQWAAVKERQAARES